MGYSQRRFGGAAEAAGQPILINNVAFTVIGVTPSEFFGVDPGAAPDVYLPMHARLLFDRMPRANSRPELLLGPDDGPPASRRAPRAGSGRARRPIRAVGGSDGDQRSGARQSSGAAPRGRRGRTRQPQAPVLEAALRAAGDGRSDPGDRVREHGEPVARAGRRPQARDGRAAQPGRRTLARRASTADGERPPGVAQRRARHPHRRRRHPCADPAAGQRAGGIHASRRTELARARRHAGVVACSAACCSAWRLRCKRRVRR